MSTEKQIQALLDKAAPLRLLPEDQQDGLGAIVEQINALRAKQAGGEVEISTEVIEGEDATEAPAPDVREVKRGPGRPKKAAE